MPNDRERKKERITTDISVPTPLPVDRQDLNAQCRILAQELAAIYSLRRKRDVSPSVLSSWTNQIRLMTQADNISLDDIHGMLTWYRAHWNDNKYVPVVESAGALRTKWDKLLAAVEREKQDKAVALTTGSLTSREDNAAFRASTAAYLLQEKYGITAKSSQ